ncbi:very short patch repair endonuclease [Deinococcus sp. AJ005]|uniref:very short patch repair endonuclease n=1 Tax=Deinococcus sp. AJ005 TaxID=2652443 RepID=UPI00125CCB3F|nr:very short patch repair endonuclease [Deinococcus sp. AJ005]QFP75027.1 very short patch repair endonuclease [Deinococcus sp. AJ005]
MADKLSREQRSALMGRVRQRDTAPELALRSALHRRGLRFRKNVKGLPGSPDIVFTRIKVAVFVDGNFWHGYDFDAWKDRLQPFWRAKIERNIERDRQNGTDLEELGWQVVRIWEKDIKKRLDEVAEEVAAVVELRRGR